jgi:hypothetical protein
MQHEHALMEAAHRLESTDVVEVDDRQLNQPLLNYAEAKTAEVLAPRITRAGTVDWENDPQARLRRDAALIKEHTPMFPQVPRGGANYSALTFEGLDNELSSPAVKQSSERARNRLLSGDQHATNKSSFSDDKHRGTGAAVSRQRRPSKSMYTPSSPSPADHNRPSTQSMPAAVRIDSMRNDSPNDLGPCLGTSKPRIKERGVSDVRGARLGWFTGSDVYSGEVPSPQARDRTLHTTGTKDVQGELPESNKSHADTFGDNDRRRDDASNSANLAKGGEPEDTTNGGSQGRKRALDNQHTHAGWLTRLQVDDSESGSQRWFVIRGAQLLCFRTPSDWRSWKEGHGAGVLDVTTLGISSEVRVSYNHRFKDPTLAGRQTFGVLRLSHIKGEQIFLAETEAEMMRWVEALDEAIDAELDAARWQEKDNSGTSLVSKRMYVQKHASKRRVLHGRSVTISACDHAITSPRKRFSNLGFNTSSRVGSEREGHALSGRARGFSQSYTPVSSGWGGRNSGDKEEEEDDTHAFGSSFTSGDDPVILSKKKNGFDKKGNTMSFDPTQPAWRLGHWGKVLPSSVELSIPSWRNVTQDEGGRKVFTLYCVEVIDEGNEFERRRWVVFKRYTDFEILEAQLRKKHRNKGRGSNFNGRPDIPTLPPKGGLFEDQLSHEFVGKRRAALEDWLRLLVSVVGFGQIWEHWFQNIPVPVTRCNSTEKTELSADERDENTFGGMEKLKARREKKSSEAVLGRTFRIGRSQSARRTTHSRRDSVTLSLSPTDR